MSTDSAPRALLILDLDETLVHTVEKALPIRSPDFTCLNYFVYSRPFLREFLERMWKLYDIAIWSAAGALYVEPAVKTIMDGLPQPVFVWSGKRCTRRFDHESMQEYYIKDLKKVRKRGFDAGRILIVDDLELNAQRNYGNAVYIREYDGSPDDKELLYLADYLESLHGTPNFRTVEKRHWRKQYP